MREVDNPSGSRRIGLNSRLVQEVHHHILEELQPRRQENEVLMVAQLGGNRAQSLATELQNYVYALSVRNTEDANAARGAILTIFQDCPAGNRQALATEACQILNDLRQDGHTYALSVVPGANGVPPRIVGRYTRRDGERNVITDLDHLTRITVPMPGQVDVQPSMLGMTTLVRNLFDANNANAPTIRTDIRNTWRALAENLRTPPQAGQQPPFIAQVNAQLANGQPPLRLEFVPSANGQRDRLRVYRTDTNALVAGGDQNPCYVGELTEVQIAQLDRPPRPTPDGGGGGEDSEMWLVTKLVIAAIALGAGGAAIRHGLGIPALVRLITARRAAAAQQRQLADLGLTPRVGGGQGGGAERATPGETVFLETGERQFSVVRQSEAIQRGQDVHRARYLDYLNGRITNLTEGNPERTLLEAQRTLLTGVNWRRYVATHLTQVTGSPSYWQPESTIFGDTISGQRAVEPATGNGAPLGTRLGPNAQIMVEVGSEGNSRIQPLQRNTAETQVTEMHRQQYLAELDRRIANQQTTTEERAQLEAERTLLNSTNWRRYIRTTLTPVQGPGGVEYWRAQSSIFGNLSWQQGLEAGNLPPTATVPQAPLRLGFGLISNAPADLTGNTAQERLTDLRQRVAALSGQDANSRFYAEAAQQIYTRECLTLMTNLQAATTTEQRADHMRDAIRTMATSAFPQGAQQLFNNLEVVSSPNVVEGSQLGFVDRTTGLQFCPDSIDVANRRFVVNYETPTGERAQRYILFSDVTLRVELPTTVVNADVSQAEGQARVNHGVGRALGTLYMLDQLSTLSESQANNAETRRVLAGNASLFGDHVALTLNESSADTRDRATELHSSLNSSEPIRVTRDNITMEIDREGNRRYYEGTRLLSDSETRAYEDAQLRLEIGRRRAAVNAALDELSRRPTPTGEAEARRLRDAIADLTSQRTALDAAIARLDSPTTAEAARTGLRASFGRACRGTMEFGRRHGVGIAILLREGLRLWLNSSR